MARRSPARYLAPLALVATAVALFVIVTPSPDEEREATPNRTSESSRPGDGEEQGETPEDGERKGPRRYTVKAGDTPSSIAERTGVPLETLLELNPDLDPQSLNPGERIKLRESGQ